MKLLAVLKSKYRILKLTLPLQLKVKKNAELRARVVCVVVFPTAVSKFHHFLRIKIKKLPKLPDNKVSKYCISSKEAIITRGL